MLVRYVCKNGNHNNIDETDSYIMLHVDNFYVHYILLF